jgi:NAD+ kinase
MHGGSAPPLVVPGASEVQITVHPGYTGFDLEVDGHAQPPPALEYRVSLREDKVTLVSFDEPGVGLVGLRKRRLVIDSPRILARDDRAARAARGEPPTGT